MDRDDHQREAKNLRRRLAGLTEEARKNDDAWRRAQACGASVLIPVHWGETWGSPEDVERMRARFAGEVKVLPRAL